MRFQSLILLAGLLFPCYLSLGQSMRIDSIHFVGNEKTRENILRRELDFHEKDSLSIQDLNERIEFNRRKLMNTNLFIWVKSDYHQLPNGHLSITFECLEQWYILAYPVFQLADRNLNDWWSRGHDFDRAIYGLHFLHNNFMGRNEKVVIKAETGFTDKLEISYQNPYLDPQKTLGMTVNLAYSTQKNLAYKTNQDTLTYIQSNAILREKWTGGIQFRKRFRFYDFQTLEFKYNHSIISDTIAKLNPAYFGAGRKEQNYAQIGYAFSYDFRDFVTYPLRGRKIDVSFTKYGLLPSDQVDFWEASAAAAFFFDLGSRFFLASQVKTKISRDGFIPYLSLTPSLIMFKSILSARKEIVRLLLGAPSLQRALLVDGLESAIKEKETIEPGIAFVVETTRAPMSLLRVAITKWAGPVILMKADPEPTDSTPGIPEVKLTEEAFEYPHTRRVSTPLT